MSEIRPEQLAPLTGSGVVARVDTGDAEITWGGVPAAALPAHHTTHENGGADEISVAGLSGLLADAQTPLAHKTSHENGGADEISVAGLSGLLADGQTPLAHHTAHENGGADEISVAGLSGLLADAQTALAHASKHEPAGTDEIDWDGKIIMAGLHAARPAAAAGNAGCLYFETDVDGGSLFRSTGAAWVKIAAAITETAGGDLTGSFPSPTLAAAGPGATGPLGGATVAPIITIDAKGRVTALSSATITGTVPGSHGSTHAGDGSDPVPDFVGATVSTNGVAGLVKAPLAAQRNYLLKGNGGWADPVEMLALAELSDVTAKTGTGTVVVMQDSPSLTTPTIADHTNATHDHTTAAQGGLLTGRLLNIQYLYNGTTTYTPTAGTKTAIVEGWAGGGGGGATDWTSGTTAAGAGGGGSGSYFEYKVTSVTGTYTVAIGAGGLAGTVGVSGGAGGTGGATTFVNGATTVTANGGVGAAQATCGSAAALAAGGAGGAVSTNGNLNIAGDTGLEGQTISSSLAKAGKGGSTSMGGGGAARILQGNGIAGNGYGSGGSGGVSTSADKTGGAGANGLLRIWEFS